MKRVRPYPFDRLPRLARNQVEVGRAFRAHLPLRVGPSVPALEREVGPLRFRVLETFVARARDLEALLSGVVLRLAAPGERWALLVVDRALAIALARAALGLDRAAEPELPAPRAPTWAEIGAIELVAQLLVEELSVQVVGVVETEDLLGLLGGLTDEALVQVLEARLACDLGKGAVRLIVPEGLVLAAPTPRPRAALAPRLSRLEAVRVAAVLELGRAPIEAAQLTALRGGDVLAFPNPASAADRMPIRLRVSAGAFDAVVEEGRVSILSPFRLHQGADMPTDTVPRDDAGADQLLRELPVEIVCELGRVSLTGRDLLELEPGAVVPIGRPLSGPVDLTVGGRLIARGELVDVEGDLGVRLTEVID